MLEAEIIKEIIIISTIRTIILITMAKIEAITQEILITVMWGGNKKI